MDSNIDIIYCSRASSVEIIIFNNDKLIAKRMDRLRDLQNWFQHAGVEVNNDVLKIVVTKNGGLGVVSKRNLEPNTLLARTPKGACLSRLTSRLRILHELFWDGFQNSGFPDELLLPLCVFFEKLMGNRSPYYGYLKSVPAPYEIPILWPKSDFMYLQSTELKNSGEDQRMLKDFYNKDAKSYFGALYDNLNAYLENANDEENVVTRKDLEAAMKASQVDLWNLFQESYAICSSRAFYVDEAHGEALVPFGDMLNHKVARKSSLHGVVAEDDGEEAMYPPNHPVLLELSEMEAGIGSSDDHQYVKIITLKEISANSEIFNTYGEHGNAVLLHDYGFVSPTNPFNIVNLDHELLLNSCGKLSGSSRNARRRSRFILRHAECFHLDSVHTLDEYSARFELPQSLLRCVLLLSMSDQDLGRCETLQVEDLEAYIQGSTQNEKVFFELESSRFAKALICEALKERMRMHSQLLNTKGMEKNKNFGLACALARSENEILKKVLVRIQTK